MPHDSEKKYRIHGALNNSLLSAFDKGLKEVRDYYNEDARKENKKKPHFRRGLALDCLLLTPENFEEDTIITKGVSSEYTHPAILVREWVRLGHTKWNPIAMEVLSNQPLYKDAKLWGQTKDTAKRIENFDKPEWRDYFNCLIGSKNYISEDEYEVIKHTANRLKTNPYTSAYFNMPEGWELVNQMHVIAPLELTIAIEDTNGILESMPERYIVKDGICESVWVKGLFDIVRINHNDKKIYPGDLKSTSKAVGEHFQDHSFLDYSYFRQGALYDYLVRYWAKENYPDYSIELFDFVVCNLDDKNEEPLSFQVSETNLTFGMVGGSLYNRKYKGIIELCEEYATQEASGDWYLKPWQQKQRNTDGKIKINFPVVLNTNYYEA
jgi:hypothetical protein